MALSWLTHTDFRIRQVLPPAHPGSRHLLLTLNTRPWHSHTPQSPNLRIHPQPLQDILQTWTIRRSKVIECRNPGQLWDEAVCKGHFRSLPLNLALSLEKRGNNVCTCVCVCVIEGGVQGFEVPPQMKSGDNLSLQVMLCDSV